MRLGTNDERNYDRRLVYMFWVGKWRRDWREAELAKNYRLMDILSMDYDRMQCL